MSCRRQGLHHVAINEMPKGWPSLERVAVSMLLPLISLSVTEGRAAEADNAVRATAAERNSFLNIS